MLVLLHPRTLKQMKLQLRMGSAIKVLPYKWNRRTERIEELSGFWPNAYWISNFIVSYLYTGFVYYRFIELVSTKPFEEIHKIHFAMHATWVVGLSFSIVAHFSISHRKAALAEFGNSLFLFIKQTERSWPETNSGDKNQKLSKVELLLQIFPISPCITVWANFFTVVFFSSSPQFMTSLLSPELRESWPILISFGLLDYYICLGIWKQYLFVTGFMMAYFKVMSTVLAKLKCSAVDKVCFEEDFLHYRAIQVLNKKFNDAYAPFMLTICPFVLFIIEILCGVASIKLFSHVPIAVFAFFPVLKFGIAIVLIAITKMVGQVLESCYNLQKSWKVNLEPGKDQGSNILQIAYAKSCQPAVAKLGPFTYIGINAVTFYVNFVIIETISALVLMEFD